MNVTINLNDVTITKLDLAPVETLIESWLQSGSILEYEQKLQFQIDWTRDDQDPRELSEIPEVRLWFIYLDVRYPALIFFLDWKNELARYVAMLVPHQFNAKDGLIYNPEALEILVMQKILVLYHWLTQYNLNFKSRIQSMTQMLGYDLDLGFLELLS